MSTTGTIATMPKASASRFDVSCMPRNVHRRVLEQHSVHFSASTQSWIVTIARSVDSAFSRKAVSFKFKSEREARKFAKCYTPPKLQPLSDHCQVCSSEFGGRVKSFSCRNCGGCICEKCSTRWGIRMIPKTYINSAQSLTVRVCKTCDWFSNAFCIALLQGKVEEAQQIFEAGNVNLRTSFADINREAMFPVHCAVLGGSLSLLKWLVETHACPVAVKRDSRTGRMLSVRTSADRTLVELAMTGKPKVEILRYLILAHKMSLLDASNPNLAPRTLEILLRAGVVVHGPEDEDCLVPDRPPLAIESLCEESVTTIEDACNLCFEQPMNCALTPCGHQVCCCDCGQKLSLCPVCKAQCGVLKIFRQ